MQQITLSKNSSLDTLQVGTTEPRAPGPGEVQLRVRASSLNYHDYLVCNGTLPAVPGRVPLSDAAGEITAVGPDVRNWKVGDRAISLFFPNWPGGDTDIPQLVGVPGDHVDGFARQVVTLAATALTRMPANLDFAEAATLPCAALTAWAALFSAERAGPGDTVLVQGTGGVSIFALQFAKAAGCRVIVTSSSDAKLERAKALGADHLINYRTEPKWGEKARSLTGGRGVDHIVEVGGPGTLKQSIRAARIGGHIALIGVLTGVSGEVPTAAFFQSRLRMTGIIVGSAADQHAMTRAIEQNDIKPIIDARYPLAQLATAFRYQESQQHFGKIVIDL